VSTLGSIEESVAEAMPVLQGFGGPRLSAVSSPAVPRDGQAAPASFRVPAVKNHEGNTLVPFLHEAVQLRLVAAHDKDYPPRIWAHRVL
jgi:hypothetical protein